MRLSQPRNRYPLSPLQEGMLFHGLLAPEVGVDIEQLIITLHEPVNILALRRAWNCVVARHEILRMSFHWVDLPRPMQQVWSGVRLQWEVMDWRRLRPSERLERWGRWLRADRKEGFAFDKAPLMRLALFRWGERHYELVWTFHHALLDGHAMRIVLREVFSLYDSALQGREITLAKPHPYRIYIDWLEGQDHSRSTAF